MAGQTRSTGAGRPRSSPVVLAAFVPEPRGASASAGTARAPAVVRKGLVLRAVVVQGRAVAALLLLHGSLGVHSRSWQPEDTVLCLTQFFVLL